ncbi:MAG: MBL fold metallo-hydrolase [Frankiaceae bacterium]|nr:MBL fold metallo-hydrolase [Frankiaceae bacterium]
MINEVLERDGLTVTIVETPSLGDRSYVVDDGATALVVDPQRDLDRVHAVLAERSVTLGAVAETHAHNDYVSGGLELARSAQVPYLVPCEAEVAYERVRVCDEDVQQVGTMTVRTIGTPGHTPHHVAFAVGTGDGPTMVFTGGSMLFGAVGRTDLVDPSLTEGLTRSQHASVRKLAADLPPDTAVLPTHGFGSFCSATPTTGTSSTIDEQRTQNPALTQDEEDFVQTLLEGFDAYPAYYAHMGPTNLAGPVPVDLSAASEADAHELRGRVEAGEWVVDLRSGTAFARGHVPGTFSFDASGNVVTYLGWLIPWGTPITLLGESAEQVAEVQRELVRIGIDRPAAQATAPVEELAGEQPLSSYETATFVDLAKALEVGAVHVLDVRRKSEWQESHLEGVQHIPLHDLMTRTDEVPDGPVWVHCATGFRSSIAGSVLDRAGKSVIVVADDFEKAAACGMTVVEGRS